MITVAIAANGPLEELALTLSALVPGAARGLVADAIVLAASSRDDIAVVSEAVGATLLSLPDGAPPWASAITIARRDWLLCLEAGDVPIGGWIQTFERFVSVAAGEIGRSRRDGPLAERLHRRLEAVLGTRRLGPGDLVHRSLVGEGELRRRVRPIPLPVRIERHRPGA
jgi:hypothetical protein